MSDGANIVLVIFYIFFVTVGLIFFFNITLRNVGRLHSGDLIVIAVVIVASVLYILNLMNYSKGYADTRNAQRSVDVQIIADAVDQYLSSYRYRFFELGRVPTCPEVKAIGSAPGNINLAEKLGDSSLPSVPLDPGDGTPEDTGYTICITSTSRVSINAARAENGKIITAKQ